MSHIEMSVFINMYVCICIYIYVCVCSYKELPLKDGLRRVPMGVPNHLIGHGTRKNQGQKKDIKDRNTWWLYYTLCGVHAQLGQDTRHLVLLVDLEQLEAIVITIRKLSGLGHSVDSWKTGYATAIHGWVMMIFIQNAGGSKIWLWN